MSGEIDPTQLQIAQAFNIDPKWLACICVAEGSRVIGQQAIINAVNCTPGISAVTYPVALHVAARTLCHRMSDFCQQEIDAALAGVAAQQGLATSIDQQTLFERFVYYFASTWAPVGVTNDPNNKNVNWPKNFLAAWHEA